MDIRNFFGPKAGGAKAKGSSPKSDSKPKDQKKKRAQVFSDSDSEEELVKKPKVNSKKVDPSKKDDKIPSKLKEVNAMDFFNSKAITTNPVKRKSPEKSAAR